MSKGAKQPSKKEKKYFESFKKRASRLVHDHDALKETLEKANKKLKDSESDDQLKSKLIAYVKLVVRMIRNSINGNYQKLPWQTLVMMVAGLIYFLAPLDALPDFIPVAGLVDDATILLWLGKSFQDDLSKYKAWEELNYSN
jgi:uncharacterized membrane protein YkvA (DUF1232 family)